MPDSAPWTLASAALMLLALCGFALTISGFVRARSAVHAIVAVVQLAAIALLGFWAVGFSLAASGPLCLAGIPSSSPDLERFLLLALLASVVAVIPGGALAERWRSASMVAASLALSTTIFPLLVRWTWGAGWMAAMGSADGLGHGVVDFAGGGVVHLAGGVAALAGAAVVGPRTRKFTHHGQPLAMPGHQVPTLMTGCLVLGVGWFGLLMAGAMLHRAPDLVQASVNTLLTAAASALSAMAWMRWRWGTPDPSLVANAFVAGLVSSAAGCAFLSSGASVIVGAVTGPLLVSSVLFVERRLRVDDPAGAVSVHGTCGAWGLLAVGLFADGRAGGGWNGVSGPVTGLLYGNAPQLAAQAIGLITIAVLAGGATYALFRVMAMTIGNRVSAAAEVEGLDAAELGTMAYRDLGAADRPHVSHR